MGWTLLVEFASIDRFHRGISFPYINGWIRQVGGGSLWLRFGVRAAVRADNDETGIGLSDADRAAIDAVVRRPAGPPSHIVCSHEPSPSLVRFLRGITPAIAWIADGGAAAGGKGIEGAVPVSADFGSLAAFLGLSPSVLEGLGRSTMFEAAVPDFGWEAGNAAASEAPSLPFLVAGRECSWGRRLSHNPWYDGVDLAGCARADGCTFCARPPADAPWTSSPPAVMARQIERLAATHPRPTGRLVVRTLGEPFLLHVEQFAGVVRAQPLPPCDFLLDGRADNLLARRAHLERALESLRGTGHRLHVCLVGIENFVQDELDRMNKGTTGLQNLELARMLLDLEISCPETFAFREHGGLSLLLFTPWTRLQDVATNLALLRQSRLDHMAGKALTSRLRLYPGLPICRLALRDGLVTDRYEDPRLDTARANMYADEVPWRFREPVLDAVSRILLRLDDDRLTGDPSDALSRAVASFRQALGRQDLELAECVVDAAVANPGLTDPFRLLDAAQKAAVSPRMDTPGSDLHRHSLQMLAFDAGLKPVLRLEPPKGGEWLDQEGIVLPEGAESQDPHYSGWIDRPSGLYSASSTADGGRFALALRVRAHEVGDGTPAREVLVSRSMDQVLEAVRLTNAERSQSPSEVLAATRGVGRLLGYPDCCATSFHAMPARMRDNYTWAHVRSRVAAPGPVPAILCPAQFLNEYVPCSLTCAGSRERAATMAMRLRAVSSPESFARFERGCRNPWLLFVDREDTVLELDTDEDPRGRLRFRAGVLRGDLPLLRRTAEADELVVEDTGMWALRNGRLVAALGGRAFLWWHEAPVQRDLWDAIIRLRFGARIEPPKPEETEADADDDGGPDESGPAVRFGRLLATLFGTAAFEAATRFRLAAVEPVRKGYVRMRFDGPDSGLTVLIERRRPDGKAYRFAGPFAVLHPKDRPFETPAQVAAVEVVCGWLDALAKARRP